MTLLGLGTWAVAFSESTVHKAEVSNKLANTITFVFIAFIV